MRVTRSRPSGVQEGEQIADHRPRPVEGGPVGVTVTALVQGQHAVLVGQGAGRVIPRVGVPGEAVQHDQRGSVSTPVEIVEADAVELHVSRGPRGAGHRCVPHPVIAAPSWPGHHAERPGSLSGVALDAGLGCLRPDGYL